MNLIFSGGKGEIRHFYRGYTFLHSKKVIESGGMFITGSRHLVLAGSSQMSWFTDTIKCFLLLTLLVNLLVLKIVLLEVANQVFRFL